MIIIIPTVFLTYYIFGPARIEFHSDCTDTVTWAGAMIEGKALINNDFAYACLLPFGGQLIMLPFVAIWGMSLNAHMAGMFIFTIILIASVFFLLRKMEINSLWSASIVFILMLILAISPKLREIYYNHTIYYSLGVLFLVIGLALTFKARKNPTNKSYILLGVWTMLCSINGFESAITFALPLIGSVVLIALFDEKPLICPERKQDYILLTTLVGGFFLGSIIGLIIVFGKTTPYATAYTAFSNPNSWYTNLSLFPNHWFSLFGIENIDGVLFASMNGIANALIIIFALLILVVPLIMIKSYKKLSYVEKAVLISHFILTTAILFGYVFGRLAAANWRLSPIVFTGTLTTLIYIHYLSKTKMLQRSVPFLLAPLICVSFITCGKIATLSNRTDDNTLFVLAEKIDMSNLNYGYASFWNANAITVITNEKIKVRDINIVDYEISPRHYQSNKNWYNDQENQEKYFLLLTEAENNHLSINSTYKDYIERTYFIINGKTYHILIYNYNIINGDWNFS